MTWLGKILTFVVMIGAVVWAYFTAQSYVTRVNWKTELDRERAAHKATAAQFRAAQAEYLAEIDAQKRLLTAERTKTEGYAAQIAKFDKDAAELATLRMAFQTKQDEYDKEQLKRQTTVARTLAELVTVRGRNDVLENLLVKLTLDTEDARRLATKANNEAKLALAIADEYSKRIEELQARMAAMRTAGAGGVLRTLDKQPPPVLANLRGEVTDVAGDLATLSIGVDAGLAVGTTLDIYRTEGGARYLGTVKVTSALNLFPKHAIVTFTPARNVPIERLRPEELPRKGDEVRPLNALTGGQ